MEVVSDGVDGVYQIGVVLLAESELINPMSMINVAISMKNAIAKIFFSRCVLVQVTDTVTTMNIVYSLLYLQI